MTEVGHEAEEVKEVVWTYTGWAVILLVCIGAGVFIGWSLWGDAASLRVELDKATEMVGTLKNERETLKSQLALATRDKDECQRKLSSGAAGGAAAGTAGGAAGTAGGAAGTAGGAGGTP